MIAACRACLSHFNPAWVSEEHGQFSITETEPLGSGSAVFTSNGGCIVIRTGRNAPVLLSLAQRKCADGAFISFDATGAHLHIVELKGKITLNSWHHVVQQFEGMFLTSLAMARLLNLQSVATVTCYIAGKEDALSASIIQSASPALVKTAVGKARTFGSWEAWVKRLIELPFSNKATLITGWRDRNGNVDFGTV